MATSFEAEIKEFDEVLKNTDMLVDESVQIYELESEKGHVIDELYNSLKIITEFLGFSVDLSSKCLVCYRVPAASLALTRATGHVWRECASGWPLRRRRILLQPGRTSAFAPVAMRYRPRGRRCATDPRRSRWHGPGGVI